MERYLIGQNIYCIGRNVTNRRYNIYKNSMICTCGYASLFDAREALFRMAKFDLQTQQDELLAQMNQNDSLLERLQGNDWCKILDFRKFD